ncbi:MAG: dienelactone hydrolase family protein [Deltaproteobacteria bacterium]|nr:dienelactone hydrolase family protein [Deltaproteobacteria bacterium]
MQNTRSSRIAVLLFMFVGLLFLFSCTGESSGECIDSKKLNGGQLNDDSSPEDEYPNDSDNDFEDDCAAESFPSEPFDPMQYGPYPVGNKTLYWMDENRWDPVLLFWRTLQVEVWYPAEDWSREMPRDIVRNFLGEWDELILYIFGLLGVGDEELANVEKETRSARNPKIRSGDAPYPVVLFSHGTRGLRFQNYTMCEYLASHGYVVVSPDHVGNALFTTYPNKLVIYRFLMTPLSFIDRQKDLSFLIDKLDELNQNDPYGFFTGMVDISRVGVIGHSFGANTAQEVIKYDDRIGASVAFAGPQIPLLPPDFDTPIMTMFGSEDHTMHDWEFLIRYNYMDRPPPKIMLDFINGGHYTFTDACVLLPTLFGQGNGCGSSRRFDTGEEFDFIDHDQAFKIINTYVTAFFDSYLKEQESTFYHLYMNIEPAEVIYHRDLRE